jgi:hypothetical protein
MQDKEQKRFGSSEAGCLGRAIGSQGVMNEPKLRGRAPGSCWMNRLKLEKSGGEEMSRIILVTSHSSCGMVHAAAGERDQSSRAPARQRPYYCEEWHGRGAL